MLGPLKGKVTGVEETRWYCNGMLTCGLQGGGTPCMFRSSIKHVLFFWWRVPLPCSAVALKLCSAAVL